MPLIQDTYGKSRVRVMRVHRDGMYNEVRELSVQTMLEGDFAAAYTQGDNRHVIATDTIKNITYVVARENVTAGNENFGAALASRLLSLYPQATRVIVSMDETKWVRTTFAGKPHDHSFTLDANGKPYAEVNATRNGVSAVSGIKGYTFMKSTQSGWVDYVMDDYTTLPETTDRIAATSMDATWTWLSAPDDYATANTTILNVMLEVFATTYSRGIQDSLYRMGEAALAAMPEMATITMACPNKNYLPINLDRFGLSADNLVLIPTDEPHGQIECTVGR